MKLLARLSFPVPSFLGEDAKKKIKTNFRLKAKVPLPSGEDFVY